MGILKSFVPALAILFVLPGCSQKVQPVKNIQDPLEGFNRKVFTFNKTIDKLYLRPLAFTYRKFVPSTARTVVGNMLQNVYEVTNVANDLLQGKPRQAFQDTGRVMLNTTLGCLGMFDVAGRLGLQKNYQDFGLTLARWGYKNSAYLVLPILGPSTIRDGIALPINTYMTIPYYFKAKWRNRYFAVWFLQKRSELLAADPTLNAAAVDEYAFIRDVYLQNRNFLFNPEAKASNDSDLQEEPPE